MSNTGHIKGRCRILVPVVVEYGATVKLDAGASLAKLIKLWSQGKRYPKGNVEDVWIEKIEDIDTIAIHGDDEGDAITEAVNDALNYGTFESLGKPTVEDWR